MHQEHGSVGKGKTPQKDVLFTWLRMAMRTNKWSIFLMTWFRFDTHIFWSPGIRILLFVCDPTVSEVPLQVLLAALRARTGDLLCWKHAWRTPEERHSSTSAEHWCSLYESGVWFPEANSAKFELHGHGMWFGMDKNKEMWVHMCWWLLLERKLFTCTVDFLLESSVPSIDVVCALIFAQN